MIPERKYSLYNNSMGLTKIGSIDGSIENERQGATAMVTENH